MNIEMYKATKTYHDNAIENNDSLCVNTTDPNMYFIVHVTLLKAKSYLRNPGTEANWLMQIAQCSPCSIIRVYLQSSAFGCNHGNCIGNPSDEIRNRVSSKRLHVCLLGCKTLMPPNRSNKKVWAMKQRHDIVINVSNMASVKEYRTEAGHRGLTCRIGQDIVCFAAAMLTVKLILFSGISPHLWNVWCCLEL